MPCNVIRNGDSVFGGDALIKYLSDQSLQNKTIADITDGLYTVKDINTMERSFLGLLKYDLWVDRNEVENFLDQHRVELEINFDWTNDEKA
ncbi:13941_t:CDS:2 [Racocetra fulgida]|uniref:13941_t:CDS:1 n=1 Tax=Racocetra fulgida TaxID=60492 RepID=A0A9N9G9R3_9GLOM|nr:13941_t:CDS:2 [Racocetra fulgida]